MSSTAVAVLAIICVILMVLFMLGTYRYFKLIHDGRADPLRDPGDPTFMWPADPNLPLHDPDDR